MCGKGIKPDDAYLARQEFQNQLSQVRTGEIDYDIDHKVIAKYVGRHTESMRQAKRQYELDGSGMWPHYVKSHAWDSIERAKFEAHESSVSIKVMCLGCNTWVTEYDAETFLCRDCHGEPKEV